MNTMREKLERNAPYNLFYNAIPDLPETLGIKNSITFKDLLCPSLGKLKSCLFLNKKLHIEWLLEQFDEIGLKNISLIILYSMDENVHVPNEINNNVQIHNVSTKDADNSAIVNRSRMAIFHYEDNSLRIMVMSGNLEQDSWNSQLNCVWISSLCPALLPNEPNHAKPGIADFKLHLLAYLYEYHLSILDCWFGHVQRADFSEIKVCLITSVPGPHTFDEYPSFCHLHKVGQLLSMHCYLPDEGTAPYKSWPVIAQVTTVGAVGKSWRYWLQPYLFSSLFSHKRCRMPRNAPNEMKLLYPSKNNVTESLNGEEFSNHLHFLLTDIRWTKQMLHVWKADEIKCTKIMPHLKTYCRISPCNTKLAWFFFTSANISKSAWGSIRGDRNTNIKYNRTFQLGIMFLPTFFNQVHFNIGKNFPNAFQFPYDVPLVPYSPTDEAAHFDIPYPENL